MSERVLPPFVLSSCTARARCWSTEPGKSSAGQDAKETGRPSPRGACGSREACGCGLPSYLPGPSRWRWRCGPRARDHVACRWLHRPVFFFLWLAGTGAAFRPTDRPAACWKEARMHVVTSRGTVDCEKPVHETTSISINPYTDAILNSHPSLSSFGSHMDFTRYTL